MAIPGSYRGIVQSVEHALTFVLRIGMEGNIQWEVILGRRTGKLLPGHEEMIDVITMYPNIEERDIQRDLTEQDLLDINVWMLTFGAPHINIDEVKNVIEALRSQAQL
jgi:hypothetical protein